MRTNRFRPSVGLRPSFDLLMPRIAPSDITVLVYTNPAPVADPSDPNDMTPTTDDNPPTIPPAPVYSSPSTPDGSPPSTTTPGLGC